LFEEVGKLDHLLMGIGGGGIISGCSIATKHLHPDCKVTGVQPAGFGAMDSFYKGEVVSVKCPVTISDGASTPHIGYLNLPIMRKNLEAVIEVQDDDLRDCMRFFGERCKTISEPTGCLGLAGIKQLIRKGKIRPG
jgi:threonine dehydratase